MLTVFIATNEALTRKMLVEELAAIDGAQVVGEADNAEAAREQIRMLNPQLVLLDAPLKVPLPSQGTGGPQFVMLTAHESGGDPHCRYLFKPVGADQLRRVVEQISAPARPAAASAGWRGRLDGVGQGVGFLCAIHCAVMPLLTGVLALAGAEWIASRRFEWSIVATSLALGVITLFPGYRQHRRRRSLVVFTAGISLILIARLAYDEWPAIELITVLAGGVLIAIAHGINRRLCRTCPGCRDDLNVVAEGR